MIRHKHNYIVWLALVILLAGIIAYMVGYNRYVSKYSGQFDDKIVQEPIRVQKDNTHKIEEKLENSHSTETDMNDDRLDMFGHISSEVISNNSDKISTGTKLTTILIDKNNKTSTKKTTDMPINMIGLTKVSLSKYYDYYTNNMPTEEMEKGLLSVRIIKFSDDEVVIQKIYDESTILYYITEENGYVKVFYADKETLYESTDILMNELPVLEQENIKAGMFVKDKDELITILEGYSS